MHTIFSHLLCEHNNFCFIFEIFFHNSTKQIIMPSSRNLAFILLLVLAIFASTANARLSKAVRKVMKENYGIDDRNDETVVIVEDYARHKSNDTVAIGQSAGGEPSKAVNENKEDQPKELITDNEKPDAVGNNEKIDPKLENDHKMKYGEQVKDDRELKTEKKMATTTPSSFFMRRHGTAFSTRRHHHHRRIEESTNINSPSYADDEISQDYNNNKDNNSPPRRHHRRHHRHRENNRKHRSEEFDHLPPNQLEPGNRADWHWNLQHNNQQETSTKETFSKPKTSSEQRIDLLKRKVKLGEIFLTDDPGHTDFLSNYGLQQGYSLRYSPPPKSEPWPMPQIFIGHEELYEIDPSWLKFKATSNDKTHNFLNECGTLREIVNRYRKGLLFQSARPIAIDDAILHPGPAYLPSVKFPFSEEEENNSANSFFYRKVVNKMKMSSASKWSRTGLFIKSVTITMAVCTNYSTENSKESYGLRVAQNGITIYAKEVWGVLYALETLSQLIFLDENNNFMVRAAVIEDWPRFRHRGLLLDSSRHFLPVSVIKQNIDAMVQNKFNVFHWHLSDDHSFPLYLNSFPEFAKLAAFSPNEVYYPEDVAEVVEYARLRGVRIMPEIDSPSHVFSWRHLSKDILTRCYAKKEPTGDLGPLDPTNEQTYGVLEKILRDVGQLFPDSAFHAGGDEVPKSCWTSNPKIIEYRRRKYEASGSTTPAKTDSKNITTNSFRPDGVFSPSNDEDQEIGLISLQDVVASYNKRLLDIFKATRAIKSKSGEEHYMVMWEEAYENDHKISRDITMHVWKNGANTVKFLIDEGFNVLFSQCWYLNYINYGVDWTKFYTCDPTTLGPLRQGASLMHDDHGVLGGEVCMWGEYIDETNLMSTLWPRASAAAERLWSSKTVDDVAQAGRRLEEHRCRMIRRGIPASPVSGPGTCGGSGFVSAGDLWQQEVQPGHEQDQASAANEAPPKKSKVIYGGRAALYYDAGDIRENSLTIRFDYGDNNYSEITISVFSLCTFFVFLLLLIISWMATRRSGLKFCRPIVSIVRSFGAGNRYRSSDLTRSNRSFISTPSPRLRSSHSLSDSANSSASRSTSSSVVKQQNLD